MFLAQHCCEEYDIIATNQKIISEYAMDNMAHDYPRFAVVGHPNKGKSSIVSSLAMDDSVQISDTPGTTIRTRSFPLRVDGRVLYELYDTPGFQRAREVLEWLKAQNVRAPQRPDAIRRFIAEHHDDPRFVDEVELLRPIVEGAVIIYVVDGSKPYGDEYEAEMEILRWSGQPSMALINLIGKNDYVNEWKGVLGQYFKLIRRYDPMKRSFEDHIALLEGMAQLREEWIGPLKLVIKEVKKHQDMLTEQTATRIAHLICDSITHKEEMAIRGEEVSDEEKRKLEDRYRDSLRSMELKTQKSIERLWHHKNLIKDQDGLRLEGIDLFSQESASIFGLTRQEMVYTGAATGAAAGAGIDLLFAGHTLLLGGLIGAAVGGAGAWWGFDELSEVKVLGMKLGKRSIEMGPMKNRNFPYILLGRSLYHAYKVASRSHALRDKAAIKMDEHFKDSWLGDDLKKELEKYHKKFRSAGSVDENETRGYEKLIYDALRRVLSQ
jgi:hypothetical protein